MSKAVAGALWCICLLPVVAAGQEFYTTEDVRSEYDQLFESPRLSTPSGSMRQANDSAVGPGMEIKDVGGIRVIVPKGARVYKDGSHVVFEDIGEYLARRFEVMETEIAALQENLHRHEQEIARLKEELRAPDRQPPEGGEDEEHH